MKRQSELIRALRAQLAATEKELADQKWIHEQFLHSPSWRWTAPVRWAAHQFRKLTNGHHVATPPEIPDKPDAPKGTPQTSGFSYGPTWRGGANRLDDSTSMHPTNRRGKRDGRGAATPTRREPCPASLMFGARFIATSHARSSARAARGQRSRAKASVTSEVETRASVRGARIRRRSTPLLVDGAQGRTIPMVLGFFG